MYKKILFLGLAASLVSGCDTGSSDNKVEQVQQEQIAPKASSTAIFLPGGGGIDFGIRPVIDKSGTAKNGKKFKSLYYDFEQDPSDVEDAIAKLLIDQKYSKKQVANDKLIYNFIYRKAPFNPIEIQVSEVFKEGFSRKTRVLFWWYE